MPFGLDKNGFTRKRVDDIRADLEDAFRGEFGDGIKTTPRSNFGILIGLVAGVLDPLWELAQTVYWALDRDKATGVQLDNLAGLIGLERLEATRSQVTLELQGTDGAVIPKGSEASNPDTGDIFRTKSEVTIQGTTTVDAEAKEKGAIVALAGTITKIQTSITGWDSVTNPEDATVGQARETDAELRSRMRTDLQAAGSATVGAIRARIAQVDGVTKSIVLENDQPTQDGNGYGLPRNSFSAVVEGGTTQDIADLIWEHKPAGIATSHSVNAPVSDRITETVIDSEGEEQLIKFSRPTPVDIYVDVGFSRPAGDPAFSVPQSVQDAVIQAILDEGSKHDPGLDVRAWRFKKSVALVPWVDEHTEEISGITLRVGKSDNPTGDTIDIAPTEVADFDSTRTTFL